MENVLQRIYAEAKHIYRYLLYLQIKRGSFMEVIKVTVNERKLKCILNRLEITYDRS